MNLWLRGLKCVAVFAGVVLAVLFVLALVLAFSQRDGGHPTATTTPSGETTSTQALGRAIEVHGVTVSPDGLTLLVTVDECAANIDASDEDFILIQIFAPVPGGDTCENHFTIRLHDPLGDRNVIDGFDGGVISIATGD